MEDLRSDALLSKTTEVKGYKILPPCVLYARIGVGGMGAVYRGHHLNLDIEVAVKCLKPSLVEGDPTFVDRFKREGRSAAKINRGLADAVRRHRFRDLDEAADVGALDVVHVAAFGAVGHALGVDLPHDVVQA